MKLLLLCVVCFICSYSEGHTKDKQPVQQRVNNTLLLQNIKDSFTKKGLKPLKVNKESNELNVPVWLDLKVGVSTMGLAGNASISAMVKNKFVFTANAFGTSTESTFTIFKAESWTGFGDYSITAGRVISNNPDQLMILVAAGVSYTNIKYHILQADSGGWFANFEERDVNTIGFPVDLKLYIPTHTAFGINIDAQAYLNKEKSIFALTLGLRIGRIKSR